VRLKGKKKRFKVQRLEYQKGLGQRKKEKFRRLRQKAKSKTRWTKKTKGEAAKKRGGNANIKPQDQGSWGSMGKNGRTDRGSGFMVVVAGGALGENEKEILNEKTGGNTKSARSCCFLRVMSKKVNSCSGRQAKR